MKDVREKFKKVKLLILDVDGVLTKGEIMYDNKGRELKIFNVKDGLGIFLLHKCGINTILLTAKDSDVVKKRAQDMRACEVIGGKLPKSNVLPLITKKYKVSEDAICFVGDDLIDMGIMRRVGISVAVGDAPCEVKRCAHYITRKKGGEGAVREVVECILKSKKFWNKLIKEFDKIVRK